jgi:proline racemase
LLDWRIAHTAGRCFIYGTCHSRTLKDSGMRSSQSVDVIYTHTAGEPTCIVHSGIFYPAGTDIWQKRRFLEERYDWLRRALMREPRGHKHMFGVFLTPPSTAETHAGMIWIDGERFHDMCGHGTIAVSMVLLANGFIPANGTLSTLRLETTAGVIAVDVSSRDGGVEWARFANVPAFVAASDVRIALDGYDEVLVDVAFGGNFFGQVDWTGRKPSIRFDNADTFSELGTKLKSCLQEHIEVRHPTLPEIKELNFVTFYESCAEEPSLYRTLHVFSDGKVDRSPGGTGTSALMATLEHKQKIRLGEKVWTEGPLGAGRFEAVLIQGNASRRSARRSSQREGCGPDHRLCALDIRGRRPPRLQHRLMSGWQSRRDAVPLPAAASLGEWRRRP